MASSSKTYERLFEAAESQQGFFTTKQAKAAGYAENTHPYHVQTGNWIRELRGIYRLAHFPLTEHPDLVQWSLWSKNRGEETLGVYSHETALRLHELSDINPAKLHMTVPPTFRRSSQIPGVLVLHYRKIPKSEIQQGQGFQYTRPIRTILDIVESNTMEHSFIRQAILQALNRGLVTRAEIQKVELPQPLRDSVKKALKRPA